jgi:hypothetical protein
MSTSNQLEYLYGLEYSDIADMPYKVALQLKLDVGKELLQLLRQEKSNYRDYERISAICKALDDTSDLLDELYHK